MTPRRGGRASARSGSPLARTTDSLAGLPLRQRQREGGAASHEPASSAGQSYTPGHHPLDRASAVLRCSQRLERGDDPDRPRVDRQQSRVRREDARSLRSERHRGSPSLQAKLWAQGFRKGCPSPPTVRAKPKIAMLAKRVIPCLDVGSAWRWARREAASPSSGFRDAGDPVECAARLRPCAGADEIALLDITASHERRRAILEVVARVADVTFHPR